MGLQELTSRDAILAAIEEYDRLGREAFLGKYGYGGSQHSIPGARSIPGKRAENSG